MSEIPPPVPSGPAESCECPICLRPAKPWKCKTLYGVKVCSKCRNGLANRRQAAYVVDALIYWVAIEAVVYGLARMSVMGSPAAADIADAVILILGWLVFPIPVLVQGTCSPGARLGRCSSGSVWWMWRLASRYRRGSP